MRPDPVTNYPCRYSYHGGLDIGVIKKLSIFTIYWGDEWNTMRVIPPNAAAAQPTMNAMNDFLTFIVNSTFMDLMHQYSVPGHNIQHGSFAGTLHLPTSYYQLSSPLKTLEVQGLVHDLIFSGPNDMIVNPPMVPANDENKLYIVFTPPGLITSLTWANADGSWTFLDNQNRNFAYHVATTSHINYALIPYPNLTFWDAFNALNSDDDRRRMEFDTLTAFVTHEIAEAVTNPDQTLRNGPGFGWITAPADGSFEIADTCQVGGIRHAVDPFANWTVRLNGYVVSKIWSCAINSCDGPAGSVPA